MTQSKAMGLEGKVTTFRQIATHWLEALVTFHRVRGILFAPRNWREGQTAIASLADDSAVENTGNCILCRLMHTRHVRNIFLKITEVEGVDEVAQLRTTPLRNFLRVERLAMCLGPLLHKQKLTFMRGVLGENVATTRERRDNVEWNTEAWSNRLKAKGLVIWVNHPLRLLRLGSMRSHNVVRPSTSFIVRVNQSSRVPVFTMHDSISNLSLEPAAV